MNKKIIVGIFIILIVILGLGTYFVLQRSNQAPFRAQEEMLKLVLTGQYGEAYRLTSTAYSNVTPLDEFTNSIAWLKDGSWEGSTKVEKVSNNVPKKYHIRASSGAYAQMTISSVNEDGKWKIDTINVEQYFPDSTPPTN